RDARFLISDWRLPIADRQLPGFGLLNRQWAIAHRQFQPALARDNRALQRRRSPMAFPPAPAILAARDLRAADLEKNPRDALLRTYAWMHLARIGDNRILELFRQGLI